MQTKTIRRLCALLALCLVCVLLSASGRRLPASMVFPSEQADAALPPPLTATLQGKTVTMAYTAITAIPWPTDVHPTWFHNGFMPVYGYVDLETGETAAGGAYMNTTGRIICEPIYDELYDFDDTGFAIAEKFRPMDRGCRCTNMSGHAAMGNPFIRAAGRGRSMSTSTATARLLPAQTLPPSCR